MKKALMSGVSGAAMILAAAAANAAGIGLSQDFHAANSQGSLQSADVHANAGDGGSASAKAAGGDAGSSSSHYMPSSGGDGGYAKAYGAGGDGGYAKADTYQDQMQKQYVSGSQQMMVYFPEDGFDGDANVGTGGAGGPPTGGDAISNTGDQARIQSHDAQDDAIIADRAARVVRQLSGSAIAVLGDGSTVNRDSFNVNQNNTTDMNATNNLGNIDVSSGNSNGGNARGGDVYGVQSAYTKTDGYAGDAKNYIDDTKGGGGGGGGGATADVSSYAKQYADTYAKSSGGDGKAYSDAYGKSTADSYAKSNSSSYSSAYGKSDNDVTAKAYSKGEGEVKGSGGAPTWSKWGHNGGSGDQSATGKSWAKADAGGSAMLKQDPKALSLSAAVAPAKSSNLSKSEANAMGGAGGPVDTTNGNLLKQGGSAMAAGGNGGDGGNAKVDALAHGGDNAQMASSSLSSTVATGSTIGGSGGDISVRFGTGNIGAINLGTVHGIATVAQNSGLSANQFSSFSINANTKFQ
ncbi:MAG: hypothetical protein HY985_02110 [Magnetospirillum sp.]|nr:hypothetical protein [Magnetospirillum sp.]